MLRDLRLSEGIVYLILQVQRTYFLVSLVDNDYINGDVFAAFKDI